MTQPPLLVRDCDESQLLDLIFPLLTTNDYVLLGPGDDCAVIAAPNSQFVVSTDILIENQHFRREWSSAQDVGWRAAMQNLADIAAMGAVPTSVVLALGLPGELPTTWLQDFYRGFTQACQTVGAAVVGGDLSGSAMITVAVTVHGDMQGLSPVLRSGARPGDVVAHAGNLGWSAAGLAALESGLRAGRPTITTQDYADAQGCDAGASASAPDIANAIALFLRPEPVLTLGPVAARAGATSLMDVSDGLLRDIGRIAQASGVSVDLDLVGTKKTALDKNLSAHEVSEASGLAQVARAVLASGSAPESEPVSEAAIEESIEKLVSDWCLSGGEDHGLLGTFPDRSAVPVGFAAIGTVSGRHKGQPFVTVKGNDAAELAQGWDHFR